VVQLNGAVSGGATTGTWTTTGTGAFAPDANTLNATYTPSAADKTAGTVTLILTSTNDGSCSTVSDTMSIGITQPASVAISADTLYACANNPDVQLSGTVTGSSTTGKWITSGSGGFSPDNLTLNATYQPNAADISSGSVTLYLESTNNGNCIPVQDSLKLFFTASPTANAGANLISCTNVPEVTLNGTIGGSSSTGVWSGGDGTFTADSTTLNAVYMPTSAEVLAGEVILVLTSTNNGTCNAVSDNVQITFTPPPFANFNSTDVCLNSTTVFTDFTLPGFGSVSEWNWAFGDGQTSTVQNPGHEYGMPGIYNVQLITTTNVGCMDTIVRQVTVFSPPAAGFTYTASCNGGNQAIVSFTDASTSADPVNYWLYDFGGQGASATQNPTQLFVGSGNFIISQIVETVNGCRDTLIQVVNIPPQPTAGFSYNTTNGMNIGAVFNFVDTSSYANSYSWSFGDGNTSSLSNPSNTYFANGEYVVTQIVTGDLGCVDSASITITINTVTNEINTLIPNAISPNGDGRNDVWKLEFIKLMYPNAEVSVYNQWGQELYYSIGYQFPWGGFYRGEPVPDGTYFYVIRLNDNSDNNIYKGSILVLKNAN
jgi:gliding motility-associated-like protein